MLKTVLVVAIGLLPPSSVKNALLRATGWKIGQSSSIGPGLYIRVKAVSLGSESRIGPFNVFRDLSELAVGERGRIGQWNWVSAADPLVRVRGGGFLRLGDDSALTARHYLDCSGGVTIGHHTTVAGVRSTFITHGIDWKRAAQTTAGISIGNYCIISSNVALTPGTTVNDRVVVGMGTVAARNVGPEGSLSVGARATTVKSEIHGAYFTRDRGYIKNIMERDDHDDSA